VVLGFKCFRCQLAVCSIFLFFSKLVINLNDSTSINPLLLVPPEGSKFYEIYDFDA